MPNKNNNTLAQEQMKIKPKIEEIIPEFLDGELKEAAFEFIAYLKLKKHTPRYSSFNSWKVSYKSKMLFYIKIEKNILSIAFHLEKFNCEHNEALIKAIQDNLSPCNACLKACRKGMELIVFGKKFTNICHYWTIKFVNPNINTLEHVKELMECRKGIINAVS